VLGRDATSRGGRREWCKAKLKLPAKRRRKRIASTRHRPLPPRAANHVWAYDFVFDACANGQQIKCLSVVDEFTRACLAIDVAGSMHITPPWPTRCRKSGRWGSTPGRSWPSDTGTSG
jgi:transposase InsO family protein